VIESERVQCGLSPHQTGPGRGVGRRRKALAERDVTELSAEDLVGWLQEIVSDPDEPTGVSAVAPTMTLDEVNVAHEKAIEEKVKALGAPEI
jgi:hypothetical protein